MIIRANHEINKVWSALVFLMFALPVNFQWLKASLLLISFLLSLFLIYKRNNNINKCLLYSVMAWLAFVASSASVGAINNNPGLYGFIKVNFIYYGLLFVIILSLDSEESIDYTIKAVYYANYLIAIYSFYLLLYGYGLFRGIPMITLDDTANVGFHAGYTHVTNTNLSMTIFTFPFLAVSFKSITNKRLIKSNWLLINLLLVATAMLLSGRRILWIVLFITVIAVIIGSGFDSYKKLKYICIIIIASLVVINIAQLLFGISFTGYYSRFFQVFNRINESGTENVRYQQSRFLMNAFKEHFLFGSGAGGIITNYSRSKTVPWAFELSYHSLLFHSGIIGTAFYALSFLILLFNLGRIKNEMRNGILLAFLMALFANATNPYIAASFDFWLFVFIPMIFINYSQKVKNDDSLLQTR